MKKILVTGGAGFIGSHLCEKLLADGHEVLCIDNYFTGLKSNISHLINSHNFELMLHDITVPLYVEVDEIYNLACPASPIHYQYCPIQTLKTNVYGSVNMLDLAKRIDAKILQASTSEVYGDPLVHPQIESYWGNVNPIGTRACYDEGKRCAETLCSSYFYKEKVQVKIARIFNTYGPRMQPYDGRVISNFIIQALQKNDITIYGNGSQSRSFCYIDDLVEGLIKLMATENDFVGPVNLGNPIEISILDVAKKIIELTNTLSKIVYKPLPQDDPKRRCPDISLARDKLNWHPNISLEEGLKRTIDYYNRISRKPRAKI
jgi:UDP-glucuronate decarboxylase